LTDREGVGPPYLSAQGPKVVSKIGAMVNIRRGRVWSAALLVSIGLAIPGLAARADVRDYGFELVDREIKQGYGATITVRLVHRPTGKVVPDAVVFMSRIDMSPDGMGDMTAPLEPVSDTLPGYFRFETDLVMEGAWALNLTAKVPGEPGYVQGKLVLEAVP
jgi:hypothetical protein